MGSGPSLASRPGRPAHLAEPPLPPHWLPSAPPPPSHWLSPPPPRALLVSARYLEGSEERLPLPPSFLPHWRQSRRAAPSHWLPGRPRARIGGRLRGAPPRGGQSGAFGLESCRRRSAARGCGRREPGARCRRRRRRRPGSAEPSRAWPRRAEPSPGRRAAMPPARGEPGGTPALAAAGSA